MNIPELFGEIKQKLGCIYWERIITILIVSTLLAGIFNMVFRFSGIIAQIVYISASIYLSVPITIRLHPKYILVPMDKIKGAMENPEN